MSNAPDMTGKRFGRLVVVSREPRGDRKSPAAVWRCKCDCGGEAVAQAGDLRNGRTSSCGCYHRERASATMTGLLTKHGRSHDYTYSVWAAMKQRCTNPNNKGYKYYGGRGITYDQRWEDFSVFLADMGPRPEGLTLERDDVNGNYCKSNCRWATWEEQAKNKRSRSK